MPNEDKNLQEMPDNTSGENSKSGHPSTDSNMGHSDKRPFVLQDYDDNYEVFSQPKEDNKRKQKKKKKKRRVLRRVITILIMLAISFGLAFTILISAKDMMAIGRRDEEMLIEIPYGSTAEDIALLLEENGIIDYALVFRVSIKLQKSDGVFRSGYFKLNPAMSHREVIETLQKAPDKESEDGNAVKITFVEGKTVRDYANLLEENGVCKADDFLKTLNSAQLDLKFMEKLKDVPNSDLIFNRMEGYVFPATYDFKLNTPAEEVVETVLKKFDSKIQEDWWSRMKYTYGWTLNETMALASIIEKEASVGSNNEIKRSNMQKVSAVFHNRLKNPSKFPKLESDPTILYVEDYIKPFISSPNQSMYDAYNTYKCKGIPVGPICNPSIDAIEAALFPSISDDYFFVTDKEGNFYYAKTNEEHEANCIKAGEPIGNNE